MAGDTKSSKTGRNHKKCEHYKFDSRHEKNQLRRMIRHFKKQKLLIEDNGFAPQLSGGSITTCWNKLNAKLANYQIKAICTELNVIHI